MISTIYDVAEKAAVSISTVSRVLNHNANVREQTKQKILKVIADLNFSPNRIARALVVNEVNLVQVCFSWSSIKINLENAWYTGLFNGINEMLQENQIGLLINTISGVFGPDEVLRRVSQNKADGILLVSPYLKKEELTQIRNFPVPVVLIGSRVEDPGVDFVDCDNEKAVKEVVDHLAKQGHKKIAIITGEVEISADAANRLSAFRLAMDKNKLNLPESYIVGGDFAVGTGKKAMEQLLSLKDGPTAVFASNDLMALGAWEAIQEDGLKVGKDIALVGFDDIAQASRPPFSLTTVHQDYRAIGAEATRLLIGKIRDVQHWKTRQVLVPTELIVRNSSGLKKKRK